jgi:hypothetical protein
MPKQLYKIVQFHGGLNSNSDARDIAESELSEATDIMVDELGKIRMMGGIATHGEAPANGAVINPGYGLFQFSHDRLEGETAGAAAAETGDDYLAMADADGAADIDIYSRVEDTWGTSKIDLGSTTGMKSTFYSADGALRVSDGNFGANNESKWYGYIYRRFFGDGTTGYDGTGYTNGLLRTLWHADEASPKALPMHSAGNRHSTAASVFNDSYPIIVNLYGKSEFYSNTASFNAALTEDQTINATINWNTTANTLTNAGTYAGFDNFCSIGDRILVASASNEANNKIFTVAAVADTTIKVDGSTTSGDTTDNIYIYNLSKSDWYGGEDNEGLEIGISTLYDDSKQESAISKFEFTGTNSGTSDTVMTDSGTKSNGQAGFGTDNLIGYIIKNLTDGSEGRIIDNDANTITVNDLTGGSDNSWDADDLYSISEISPYGIVQTHAGFSAIYIVVEVFAGDGSSTGLSIINPRVSGFKVYMRFRGTDEWYEQADIDITNGFKFTGIQSYRSWEPSNTLTYAANASARGNLVFYSRSLRQVETYEGNTGLSSDYDEVGFAGTGTGFKTAVIANRMAYVGNVKIKDKKGNTAVHGDAVLKSRVNKFDSFTLDRIIEASVNDGDSIVKLEAYADRLLIFKKNKMELLNISQEVEFLEDTFMHKGVSHPAATCKTDFGIAWVNKQGCYLYDGQKVNNLLEKQGRQIIKESDWATFTTNEPIIGYIPKKRQILVADDNSATGTGKTFLYDIVTQSWVKGADATITSNELTNFVTDWNGDLIYAHTDGAGTVVKWSDAAEASAAVAITTKDIDFGQPGQVKRIYKFYVTHRGSASNIQLSYATNGDQDTYTEAGSELPVTSATTDWVTTAISPTTFSCYSVRLRLFSDGTTPANFEINDITIVFRLKGQR